MSTLLAIDPGSTESAYALINTDTCEPIAIAKVPNAQVATWLRESDDLIGKVAIEMIASYGMPVGAEVFDTCTWIGRYQQICDDLGIPVELVFRREVKLHLCESSRAKDGNVAQALIDRFAPGEPNRGKGTKANNGWFYGFAADIWAAYSVAVTVADREAGR